MLGRVVNRTMSDKTERRRRLRQMVEEALAIADELGLHGVGIRLDQARLELGEMDGRGRIAPTSRHRDFDETQIGIRGTSGCDAVRLPIALADLINWAA